jgi:hypothetical protein
MLGNNIVDVERTKSRINEKNKSHIYVQHLIENFSTTEDMQI